MGGGVPGRPGYQWNIGVGGTTRVSNPQKKVHQILTHEKNFSKYKKGPARAFFNYLEIEATWWRSSVGREDE